MYWRARDVMTPDVVTVSEDAFAGEIVDKLVTHCVSGLPIVDDGDRLRDEIRYEFDDSAPARSRRRRTDPVSSEPRQSQFSRSSTS